MPGLSGLDFQSELVKSGIHLPIIFITGYGDIPMSVRAIKAGAIEFLTKPFREQDLLEAVRQGFERDRDRRQNTLALAKLRECFASLTPREREIMAQVVAGRPKTSSAVIGRKNHLTSEHDDRAAMFRNGRLGRTIQVEEPA